MDIFDGVRKLFFNLTIFIHDFSSLIASLLSPCILFHLMSYTSLNMVYGPEIHRSSYP